MTTDFYFPYTGSKRKENVEVEDLVKGAYGSFNKVVEVFGGSLAFSRWMYDKYGSDLTYLVSDVDADLTTFCNIFPTMKKEVLDDVIEMSAAFMALPMDERKVQFKAYSKAKILFAESKEKMAWELFMRKNAKMNRMGFLDTTKKKLCVFQGYMKKTKTTDEFFQHTEYKCQDFTEYLEQVKDDPEALVYLDPPYLGRNNDWYKSKDLSRIFPYLENWMRTCKCKYILVHCDDPLLRSWCSAMVLENDNPIKITKIYEKTYSVNPDSVMHLVISNL